MCINIKGKTKFNLLAAGKLNPRLSSTRKRGLRFAREGINSSLFGRYDYFEFKEIEEKKRIITGIAYHFLGDNKLLIDYDYNSYKFSRLPDEHVCEFTIELKF